MVHAIQYLGHYLQARGREEGQGLVEYGLIIALVGLAVAGALTIFAGDIDDLLGRAGDQLGATGTGE